MQTGPRILLQGLPSQYPLSAPQWITTFTTYHIANGSTLQSHGRSLTLNLLQRVWNSLRIFLSRLGIFFWFSRWYHLPSVCNGLELEFVILHCVCHIWACPPSILHCICHIWACSPSILHGICYMWACSPSILHGIGYIWAFAWDFLRYLPIYLSTYLPIYLSI
jgi:hypothetical protein